VSKDIVYDLAGRPHLASSKTGQEIIAKQRAEKLLEVFRTQGKEAAQNEFSKMVLDILKR